MEILFLLIIILCWKPELMNCVEFTIEINSVECFYEKFEVGDTFDFEYQVITGDLHDFDAIVRYDFNGRKIFHSTKKEMESFVWIVEETGTYSICFYPSYYRRIYFSLRLKGEDNFMDENFLKNGFTKSPLSNIEAGANRLHSMLNLIVDYQTHYRLKESQGRILAENLLHTVFIRSLAETALLLTVSFLQVYILKNFFV